MISNSPEERHLPWAIIFDVDGTMVDNMQYHEAAWIELGRRHNLGIDHKFYTENIHSRNNNQIARKHFMPLLGLEKALAISEEKEKIYRETYRPLIREIPGLTDLLRKLAQLNVGCAAASNSPTDNVNMVLEELGIKQFFKVILDYTQISKGKPDPEILLTAAERLGVAPARCVVVEDSISGFKAAQRAKMPYIAITVGANIDEMKYATDARAVYKDYTDITIEKLQDCLKVRI